ncbi:Glycosyltransferase [Candidatus Sulfobium mesophilum]|uniref:Glycosyltransferase n=1 Tax=Candidatus Sulfobium mesophilum TaxID=2016548 RepID=A0A2U3QF94_9BACT|nr:Glycosyltransferase [Candidatus Sulfobium mesophilum]
MALISVLVPAFNEEETLPLLYEKLVESVKISTDTYEFIFVDDGSTDRTFEVVGDIAAKDSRVRAIRFSRNFGSHAACLAGLMHARGDACAFISADLQDPPDLINILVESWREGHEVVIGVRHWDDSSSRFFQNIYYRLVRRFALQTMPEEGTDVFLIDRKVVNAVIAMGEKNTSVFGLILWSGFSQAVVRYAKGIRAKGRSKWSFSKKVKLFIDTFVSFSYFPLRIMSALGIIIALAGFIYALVIIVARLFFAQAIEGWASLMVVLLLVSGVQMVMLGILGEYLWRNFDESRRRPPFIIREVREMTANTVHDRQEGKGAE